MGVVGLNNRGVDDSKPRWNTDQVVDTTYLVLLGGS